MTTEKMTVHKALCELKTLDSRIQKCMQQNPFVFANKHANSKVAGVSVGDYCGVSVPLPLLLGTTEPYVGRQ